MDKEKILKNTQEQAVASWVNYLNQIRIDRLIESLRNEQFNFDSAIETINKTLEIIGNDIVNNGEGRGGIYGMHGFIAEVAECGIGNAKEQIEGKIPIYEWINDNGPADIKRGTDYIQQKFVNSGNHLSLQAIIKHFQTYPDFLQNGGVYQIPSDHYERIKWLLSISEEQANKMPTSNGDFSLKQWKEVHEFFNNSGIDFDSIEPSNLRYDEVQKNTYESTLNAEKQKLADRNEERRARAYQESKPSLQQGVNVALVSAAIEGGMTICLDIAKKVKSGKKLKDFDLEDWKEIAGDSGIGFLKGGVRGSSIYLMTNYTATPAAVASSLVTASFGIAEQIYMYNKGELSELELYENSELLCLDASISALSSLAGQLLIPVPVVGAVIGNAVGTIMYQIAKDNFAEKEQRMIEEYVNSISQLNDEMDAKYKIFINELMDSMSLFVSLLEKAFSPDIRIAFEGSIQLAKEMGVPTEEIIDSKEKLYSYFMD